MAQNQTNPFKEITQKYGDSTFTTDLNSVGDSHICNFNYSGDSFDFNKPITGTNTTGGNVGNELATISVIPSIVGRNVTYIGVAGISGQTVGKLIVNGTEYPIIIPNTGSQVSFSNALANGVQIGTITIDGTSTDIKTPKPNWDADSSASDGIENRTHYSYFGGESQSGTVNIWNMTADGTSFYYGTKVNTLYGYPVTVGNYYKVSDANEHATEFTSQSVECVASRSFVGSQIAGIGIGNLNLLNNSLADTGEDLALLFYNWNGSRCDILVVSKYIAGNAFALNIYEKERVYVPLNIGYIPDGIQRETPAESNSVELVAGKFNNLGNIDFNDIVYSDTLGNAVVYGQFTANTSGTMSTSSTGSQTYWRGDINIVSGNTYQFFILDSFGRVEQIMGV